MTKIARVTVLITFVLLIPWAVATVQANTCTTCYIDYENGNDSWTGSAKTFQGGNIGPWKHAPGMLGVNNSNASTGDGCAANCATQNPAPGNKYILKGGVVWPYTTQPWNWTWAGSGTTTTNGFGCVGNGCIYIGYDPTWNKGIVNSVTLTRDLGGCNPLLPPTVSFSGGGGSGAAATAHVMPAAAGLVEGNVAGLVYHVTVTSQGSGYTSDPSVTISGGGCTLIRAVADIYRPIIDLGLRSAYAWNVGNGPNYSLRIWSPGLAINGRAGYVIVDHIEFRNLLQMARGGTTGCATTPAGASTTAFLADVADNAVGYNTFSNNYIHNRQTNCVTSDGITQEAADAGIQYGITDEAYGNTLENGEALFLATGSNACLGNGSNNIVNSPCVFSEMSFAGSGGYIHNNYSYATRWLIHQGNDGSQPVTAITANNEQWLILYDVGGAHVNEYYSLYVTGTLYEYNNIFHNAVMGASNQQQMGNGTTQYFFNNVSWALGNGTSNYGIDGNFEAGPSGGHFYFLNNTMFGNGGTRNCIDAGAGTYASALKVVLQNNHCITAANPYWVQPAGSSVSNWAGSPSAATIELSSAVESLPLSVTQGYSLVSLFSPTQNSGYTVTFASNSQNANLTSLCTGYLVPLCSDINGNPRPSSGPWQAGAYVYGEARSPSVAPPTGLTAVVQ
jgi:hypothetical protein